MSDTDKKILPVQDILENILDTDENPIVEGKFLYAYDEKLSFFDRGGQRFLKITTNSSEIPLTQEDILKIDFDKLKGSLNIFKTESGHSLYYTDTSGQTFELTQGSGSPVVGGVTEVTATSPLFSSGGATPEISVEEGYSIPNTSQINSWNASIDHIIDIVDGEILVGHADYANLAEKATKLGSINVGSTQRPIYLNEGVATAITSLGVAYGGTGETSYTNGQLLIGNTTGNTLKKSTLTQGAGITIANGPGSITITNTAPNVTTNLSTTHNTTTVVVNSSDGTDATINGATTTTAGVVTNAAQTFGGLKTFNNNIELGAGSPTWTITDTANSLLFTNGGVIILPKTSVPKTIAFTDSVPNVGSLKTDNTTTQAVSAEESFTSNINLHRIAKTGAYSDLIGKPIIPATTIANKVLISTTTSGTAEWSSWNSAGFLKTDTSGLVSIDTNTYSLSSHLHDDRYYTESEIDTLLNSKLDTSLKGNYNGLAELDENGKVPSGQLPSYVDDVLEYNSLANFPTTGEASKIYIAQNTNKTYRWSGTSYVEISPSIALGETASTAYRGDRGKAAYDHSLTAHAPSDAEANQILYSGVGMDFPNTAGDVTIAMGIPSNISISTQNSASGTTHTHKLVLPQDIQTTANPKFAGVELGDGNETWTIDDTTSSGDLTFKKGDNKMVIKDDGVYFNDTMLGSGAVTSVSATSPLHSSGGTIPTISVASGYTIPSNAQITAWNLLQTNATHTGDVTGSGALTIQNNVVTNSKLADMANSTIKGRRTTGTGDPEDLTPAQVRAMLNVADGANNYTHPTGEATTITAANGKVLSGIVVNNLGHVTTISSKMLAEADIPNLSISKIISLQDTLDQKSSLNHTHTTTIAADSGTNQLSLLPNTKYKLTAGGTSYIFTTPIDNNTTYAFATGTANGTFRVTPSGGTAQSISIYGLKSAAYENTSNFRNSSWVPSWTQVTEKPTFATVATSGSYTDLTNKPTIPTTPQQVGAEPANSNIQGHISSINNPHGVTADQLGLGIDDNVTFADLTLGSGAQTWEIYDHATSQKLTFKLGNAIISLDGSEQTSKTIAFTDNISPTINDWGLASETNIASASLVYNSLQKNYPEIIDLTGGLEDAYL